MSAIDLWADGFPHATREGYQQGCRGSACPGVLDHGFSCTRAQERYQGDYQFRKMVDAGMSPGEIRSAETDAVTAPKPAKGAKPKAAVKVKASTVETDPETHVQKLGAADYPLGTTRGFNRGCKDEEDCPGDAKTARTCRQAQRDYSREWYAKRTQAAETATPTEGPSLPRGASPTFEAMDEVHVWASEDEPTAEGFTSVPADAALRIDPTDAGGVIVDLTGVHGQISLRLEFAELGLATVWLDVDGCDAA